MVVHCQENQKRDNSTATTIDVIVQSVQLTSLWMIANLRK